MNWGINSSSGRFDYSSSPGKHTFSSLTHKSPLKASLRSTSKNRKTAPTPLSVANEYNINNYFNNHNNINNRDKSPLREKTESILNRSIERFCRSPYVKYAETAKSVNVAENYNRNEMEQNSGFNYRQNINQNLINAENEQKIDGYNNEVKNNNLLYSTNFKSTANTNNLGSTANTNGFSNASNFPGSPNRAEFNAILSYEDENFNSYLKELLELENEIESAKFDLIIKADFNIEDAFRIFELSGRGYLTELDVKYGMNSLDIYPSKEEIALLVKRYDMSNEGILK